MSHLKPLEDGETPRQPEKPEPEKHWWAMWRDAFTSWNALARMAVKPLTRLQRFDDFMPAINAMVSAKGIDDPNYIVDMPSDIENAKRSELATDLPMVMLSIIGDAWDALASLVQGMTGGAIPIDDQGAWGQLQAQLLACHKFMWVMAVQELLAPVVEAPAKPSPIIRP